MQCPRIYLYFDHCRWAITPAMSWLFYVLVYQVDQQGKTALTGSVITELCNEKELA